MPNLFTNPPRLPLICPSILSADFTRLGEECRNVLDAGADALHLDVMDGHFVPNLTMGPALCQGLRTALPEAFLDVHLMVTDPEAFLEPFAKAGANHITFHIEAVGESRVAEVAGKVRSLGCTAGLSINPPTPAKRALGVVDQVDLVLVMSVNPGFSGQAFMPQVLSKAEAIRSRLRPDQRLEMDGGISQANAGQVRSAGCDVIVAATAIFGAAAQDRASLIADLRGGDSP